MGGWSTPAWLAPILAYAGTGVFKLRLNLPIPADNLRQAEDFLPNLLKDCDVLVFSILPEGRSGAATYPYTELEGMVERVNLHSDQSGLTGRVLLRGYKRPSGIRCSTCIDVDRCKEQSHSLRLGADNILRPCLATRTWDSLCSEEHILADIRDAALLAIDYE